MKRLSELPNRWSRIRQKATVGFVFFLMLGFAAWMVGDLHSSYRRDIEAVRKESGNLLTIIESNILATFGKIDVVVSETAHDFAPAVSGLGSRGLVEANNDLLRRMAYIPEAQELSLRVVDANGKVVFNAGKTAELPDVNVADRAYFLRQKNDPNAGLVLSEAMLSRFTGKWLLTLSRRIVGPDGRFVGLVQAALRTEYFQGLFELVKIDADDNIALFDDERRLLARQPNLPDLLGKRVASLPAEVALSPDQPLGSYRRVSGIDDVDRLFVVRKLADFPYVLTIGRSYEKIVSQWRHKAYLYGLSYLGLALALIVFLIAYFRHERRFELLATTDGLTGLTNRRTFDSTLDFAINLRGRSRQPKPLSVILFDVDRFKQINDTFGHVKGDDVLRRVVEAMKRRIRKSDLPCRWGGEEFIVLLDDCGIDQAAGIAENIRAAIEDEAMFDAEGGWRVTVSAGIAEVVEGDGVDSLVMRADKALYQAKASGRNRVCTTASS